MHKVYLLLRNNKQQGPYSLEELLQQSLKPFDLVWVEGRSAGWKYPSEIETLKPFLETAEMPAAQTEPVKAEIEVSSPLIKEEIVHVKSITGRQVYVRMPGGISPVSFIPQGVAPQEAEESPSRKLERKAEELYQRAQAFASGESIKEEEPGLDTKYSRSLDDIKEEYSNWLYNQKRGRKSFNYRKHLKTLAVLAGAVVVFAGIYYLVFDNNEPTLLNNQLAIQPVSNAGKADPKKVQAVVKKKTYPVKKKPSSRVVSPRIHKTSKISSAPVVSKNSQAVKKQEAPVTVPEKKQAEYLPDLVKIRSNFSPDDERGVAEFPITVSNNSNEFLRFVAVDIFYLRNNGKQLEKKTLYFNNIGAHQSLTLTAPPHRKAEDVRLQMGLLSSDGGIYYAKE